jgi:TetR/AcrR family transcriptional repressor of mexJK operon
MVMDDETKPPPAPADGARRSGRAGTRKTPSRVRARIIEGARRAFLAHGYELATMDMIARYAEVARASLYYQFRDKDELFSALMREYVHAWAADVTTGADEADGDWGTLRRVALRFVQGACEPESVAFYRVAIAESERLRWLARLFYAHGPNVVAAQFRAILEAIKRARPDEVADPAVSADHLLGLLLGGHYLRRLLNLSDPALDQSLDACVDRAIDAIRARRA